MRPTPSLRSRLFLGSLLWTVGLLAFSNVVATALMTRSPQFLRLAHGIMMSALALAVMAAGLVQFRKALSPFDQLRRRLSAVRSGHDTRVGGTYPGEVQPLVDDLNGLLDHREEIVRRAIATAGDLAHGLKTPLAVLGQEAERAGVDGQADLAATMRQQVERMRRQIEYHLAHSRAAASGANPAARCPVRACADGLARTLLRLHAERRLAIEVNVPEEDVFRGELQDLEEMLGNLLDNACKWARARVIVGSSAASETVVITVDDDGPGLDPSMRDRVLQRGVRADEAAPGSGLGLAIVADLAGVYGGSITLGGSPLGGLRATLTLPAQKG